MQAFRKTKLGLMAATALSFAASFANSAAAQDIGPGADPNIAVAAEVAAPTVMPDYSDQPAASPLAKRLALIAAAGAVVFGFVRLLGPRRVARVVKETAAKTAKASAAAAGGAAKTAARVFRSPIRFIALISGLALFALTGVGLYDVEWIGGLFAGAAIAGVATAAYLKTRATLRPVNTAVRAAFDRKPKINQ